MGSSSFTLIFVMNFQDFLAGQMLKIRQLKESTIFSSELSSVLQLELNMKNIFFVIAITL